RNAAVQKKQYTAHAPRVARAQSIARRVPRKPPGGSSSRHRSLVFGLKFVVTFGAGPLSVALVAWIEDFTGGLDMLFAGLALATVVVACLLVLLPKDRPVSVGSAPAE
ncbi:MAG: hypothetical protein VW709_13345, partial [Rickettsiales bacterium]